MPNVSGISDGAAILPCKACLLSRSANARFSVSHGSSVCSCGLSSASGERAHGDYRSSARSGFFSAVLHAAFGLVAAAITRLSAVAQWARLNRLSSLIRFSPLNCLSRLSCLSRLNAHGRPKPLGCTSFLSRRLLAAGLIASLGGFAAPVFAQSAAANLSVGPIPNAVASQTAVASRIAAASHTTSAPQTAAAPQTALALQTVGSTQTAVAMQTAGARQTIGASQTAVARQPSGGNQASAQSPAQPPLSKTPASCPALSPFYPQAYFGSDDNSQANTAAAESTPYSHQQWQRLASELSLLQPSCLRSSEYYALLGAAQLNAGSLDLAAEALERALLLDSGNGAAQIDYAEVLLRQGQLFAALQLNAVLEAREDLPAALRQSVVERGAQWRSLTKQNSVQLDVSGGFDSNLNGAPDSGQLTLTLSGEPVVLNLTEDFQPVEGAFSNLRASTRAVTLTEAGRRSWDHEVRARVSEDRQSDLLQFSSQFSQATATRRRSVLVEAGASSIFFGGSALYSATQARLRVQSTSAKRCAPVYDIASQYQRFHAQPALDAWESRATVGLNCLSRASAADVVQRYGFDVGYIVSKALSANRPGDDRDGFQLTARYQRPLLRGELLAQVTATHLKDENGYSTLLAGGDERWQRRHQILIQHRTPFALGSRPALFTVGLFYQDQASNIALFDMDDASFEIGISFPI